VQPVPEVFVQCPGICRKTLPQQQVGVAGGPAVSEQLPVSDPIPITAFHLPLQPMVATPVSQVAISSSNPVLAHMALLSTIYLQYL